MVVKRGNLQLGLMAGPIKFLKSLRSASFALQHRDQPLLKADENPS
jgi:hypothetical protein